jgi:hypothetical protein
MARRAIRTQKFEIPAESTRRHPAQILAFSDDNRRWFSELPDQSSHPRVMLAVSIGVIASPFLRPPQSRRQSPLCPG